MNHEALWLKQHGKIERRLIRDLAKFLNRQIDSAADRLIELDLPLYEQIFDPQQWDEELRETVWPILQRGAILGAVMEQDTGKKELTDIRESEFYVELPDPIVLTIEQTLTEMIESDYFPDINQATQRFITDAVQAGITEGETTRQIANRIRQQMGGDFTQQRAMRIARTETTASLNAGHYAVREDLAAQGLVNGSEWLTVGDKDVRETHQQLNGVQIGNGEQFSVGGASAPYPAHHSLPAKERVRCRCTTISIIEI